MKARVRGVGVFARGIDSFDALRAHAGDASDAPAASTAKAPRPAMVPVRELRRLPDPARVGIEVASQACAMAGIGTDAVVPVFTSTLGDSAITDYMCRTLAGEEKLLSPLRFQNSVHNAPAGSLSILAGNRHPNSFVAAFDHGFALALLEALVLVGAQSAPVLLVCTDVPVPAPLSDVHGQGELGGCAMLLTALETRVPGNASPNARSGPGAVTLSASVRQSPADRSANAGSVSSTHRTATAQAWPLLEALAGDSTSEARLPVGSGSELLVGLRIGRADPPTHASRVNRQGA